MADDKNAPQDTSREDSSAAILSNPGDSLATAQGILQYSSGGSSLLEALSMLNDLLTRTLTGLSSDDPTIPPEFFPSRGDTSREDSSPAILTNLGDSHPTAQDILQDSSGTSSLLGVVPELNDLLTRDLAALSPGDPSIPPELFPSYGDTSREDSSPAIFSNPGDSLAIAQDILQDSSGGSSSLGAVTELDDSLTRDLAALSPGDPSIPPNFFPSRRTNSDILALITLLLRGLFAVICLACVVYNKLIEQYQRYVVLRAEITRRITKLYNLLSFLLINRDPNSFERLRCQLLYARGCIVMKDLRSGISRSRKEITIEETNQEMNLIHEYEIILRFLLKSEEGKSFGADLFEQFQPIFWIKMENLLKKDEV